MVVQRRSVATISPEIPMRRGKAKKKLRCIYMKSLCETVLNTPQFCNTAVFAQCLRRISAIIFRVIVTRPFTGYSRHRVSLCSHHLQKIGHQEGAAANPSRGQLELFPLSLLAPNSFPTRDSTFCCPVPRQPAHCPIPQAESGSSITGLYSSLAFKN